MNHKKNPWIIRNPWVIKKFVSHKKSSIFDVKKGRGWHRHYQCSRHLILFNTKARSLTKLLHYQKHFYRRERWIFGSRLRGKIRYFIDNIHYLWGKIRYLRGECLLPQRWDSLTQSHDLSAKRKDTSPPPATPEAIFVTSKSIFITSEARSVT